MREIKFSIDGIDVTVAEDAEGKIGVWFPEIEYVCYERISVKTGKDLGILDFGRSRVFGFPDYDGPEFKRGKLYEVTDRSGDKARWFCVKGASEATMISEAKMMKTVPTFKEWVTEFKFSVTEVK